MHRYHSPGGYWDDEDDCCEPTCTPDRPCGEGEGPCIDHSDCNAKQVEIFFIGLAKVMNFVLTSIIAIEISVLK